MMMNAMGGRGGGGAPAGAAAGGADTSSKSDVDQLLDGRYLNDQGEPLKAGEKSPFAEFRQIFVRMRLQIDQRRLPDLLAACANADLPIETRKVTLQFGDSSGGGAGNRPRVVNRANADEQSDTGPYDCVVEICGVMYLYDKPDESKVGSGSAASPAKRLFAIPTVAVQAPGAAGGGMARPK
jgi:hypothetical protein